MTTAAQDTGTATHDSMRAVSATALRRGRLMVLVAILLFGTYSVVGALGGALIGWIVQRSGV